MYVVISYFFFIRIIKKILFEWYMYTGNIRDVLIFAKFCEDELASSRISRKLLI